MIDNTIMKLNAFKKSKSHFYLSALLLSQGVLTSSCTKKNLTFNGDIKRNIEEVDKPQTDITLKPEQLASQPKDEDIVHSTISLNASSNNDINNSSHYEISAHNDCHPTSLSSESAIQSTKRDKQSNKSTNLKKLNNLNDLTNQIKNTNGIREMFNMCNQINIPNDKLLNTNEMNFKRFHEELKSSTIKFNRSDIQNITSILANLCKQTKGLNKTDINDETLKEKITIICNCLTMIQGSHYLKGNNELKKGLNNKGFKLNISNLKDFLN